MTDNELPSGWAMTSLETLVTFAIGGAWGSSPDDADADDQVVAVVRGTEFRSWMEVRANSAAPRAIPKRVLEKRLLGLGDLVVEVSGGGPTQPVGRVLLIDNAALDSSHLPLVCSNFCRRVVLTPEVDPRFVFYQLQHKYMSGGTDRFQAATTNIRNLNFGKYVTETSLNIPPLAEQKRIVAAIEEQLSRLNAGLTALMRARKNLKRLRGAVLQAALMGRLLPQVSDDGDVDALIEAALQARTTAKQPVQHESDGLPCIPESWRWVSLDLLADVVGGITKDAKKQVGKELRQIPYLRVANVQRGYLDLSDIATIGATEEQIQAYSLREGDILFNEGGDRDKLGRGWVWQGQIDPCIHQNHVFRARLHAPILDPRLLSWHGNTFGQRWFSRGGKQTTNLASISKTTLRKLPVPLPPLTEQQRITAELERQLSLIDQLELAISQGLRRAAHLRASVLAAAISGHLAEQDSSDEPASILLDRIAAMCTSVDGLNARRRKQRVSNVRQSNDRAKAVELLQRSSRRWPFVSGLHRAADVPAVSQDGG